jgi:hypothetical protein
MKDNRSKGKARPTLKGRAERKEQKKGQKTNI